MEHDALNVVFVCTGNQFRSPLAAAVFEREAEGSVRVSSCGITAFDGSPAFAEAVDLLGRLDVDLSDHRSRRLGSLRDADLVIGFERRHVEHAVVDADAPRERTLTLPQAVELLESSPRNGTPRERIEALQPGSVLEAPEVEDPIGLPRRRQQAIADEIQDLASRLAAALFR